MSMPQAWVKYSWLTFLLHLVRLIVLIMEGFKEFGAARRRGNTAVTRHQHSMYDGGMLLAVGTSSIVQAVQEIAA
jgi:hypothetical protein